MGLDFFSTTTNLEKKVQALMSETNHLPPHCLKYEHCTMYIHTSTLGLAEIGQNGPTSQKRSRSVVFLCKNEF